MGLVWGSFSFRLHNEPYVSHSVIVCFLSFPLLCFSHNHTHPFITGSTPIPSPTHSITHTHSMGHIPAKTERSPQTRFRTGANRSIDSRSSSSRSFSTHTRSRSLLLPFSISFYPLSHSILIFAKAMISQCNPSSAHSIYSMLCMTVHSIQCHSPFLHPNSLPLPTLSFYPWNECGI